MSNNPIIIPTTQDLEKQINQLRQEVDDLKRRMDNVAGGNQRSFGDVAKVIGVLARGVDSLRPPHMPPGDRNILNDAMKW